MLAKKLPIRKTRAFYCNILKHACRFYRHLMLANLLNCLTKRDASDLTNLEIFNDAVEVEALQEFPIHAVNLNCSEF